MKGSELEEQNCGMFFFTSFASGISIAVLHNFDYFMPLEKDFIDMFSIAILVPIVEGIV